MLALSLLSVHRNEVALTSRWEGGAEARFSAIAAAGRAATLDVFPIK